MPVTLGAIGLGVGAYQAISGGIKQNKALKGLEGLQTPTTTNNAAIDRFYNEALSRYGVSPYNSRLYQVQKQNIGKNLATGLNAANDRRSGVANVGALVGQSDNSILRAATEAENQNNQRFGQLGTATNMKSADDKYVFGINKMLPYQKQAQLYSLKAGAGGQQLNAGLSSINNAINAGGQMYLANKMYGQPNIRKTKPLNSKVGYTPDSSEYIEYYNY